jgi:hypothetical protein
MAAPAACAGDVPQSAPSLMAESSAYGSGSITHTLTHPSTLMETSSLILRQPTVHTTPLSIHPKVLFLFHFGRDFTASGKTRSFEEARLHSLREKNTHSDAAKARFTPQQAACSPANRLSTRLLSRFTRKYLSCPILDTTSQLAAKTLQLEGPQFSTVPQKVASRSRSSR